MTNVATSPTSWSSFDIEVPPALPGAAGALAAALRVASVIAGTHTVVGVLRGTAATVCSIDARAETWGELIERARTLLRTDAPAPDLDATTAQLVFASTPTATPIDLDRQGHRETLHVAHAQERGASRALLRVGVPSDAPFAASLRGMMQRALAQACESGGSVQASLVPPEQAEQLRAWNDTATAIDLRTVVEHVEAHAAQRPDQVAVVDQTRSLSYAALAERAALLAGALRHHGVEPGSPVGVHLHRGADLLVCLLGIMKAGAAYVPLDPSFPSERLDFMVQDAGIDVMLTQAALVSTCPGRCSTVLAIDDDAMRAPARWDGPGCTAQSTAYVLYTSGSTGQPKGVEVPHLALSNFLQSMAQAPGLRADDTLLAATSLSFDIAGLELYLPLLCGATVVIAGSGDAADGHALASRLHAIRPTVFQATPSGYRMLLAAGWTGDPAMRLLCGGEALPAALAEQLLPKCAELWNLYGPTETTIWSSVHQVRSAAAPISIGRPIANTTLHVLDAERGPLPIGVAGELYIGGAGLARGYFGRDELTDQAFVEVDGSRLYRTGDIARLSQQGTYEHLGRTDQQVKVRGFRIELGEIEAALQKVPTVEGAVAVVDTRDDGGRLLAYVASADPNINMYEVRNLLARALPAYMVPTAFVFLEQLPLTPNGKVDRNALPAIEKVYVDDSVEFAPPTHPHEATIARVWSEVLGLDAVGIDDNYFGLGGDSIRSVAIVTHMRERGLETTVAQLFDTPTIRSLAATVRVVDASPQASVEPFALVSELDRARLPPDLDDALPLTSLQIGMLHVMASHPDAPVYINSFGSKIEAPFDRARLEGALRAMTQRHPAMRSSIDVGSYAAPLQLVHATAPVGLTVEDLRDHDAQAQRAAIEGWMQRERVTPFDVARAPLVRFHVARTSDDAFSLLHTTHHALFDGWSTSAMVTELVQRYDAALGDEPWPEAEPLVQPLRARAAADLEARTSEASARFWRETMAGHTHAPLPEAWTVPRWQHRRVGVSLPASTMHLLRALADSTQTSMHAVILAGHIAVMAYVTGQDDVVTGVSVPGRPEVRDAAHALGLFLNTVPLRQSARAASWRALVEQAHAMQRAVTEHGLVPLARTRANPGATFTSLLNFMDFHVFDQARSLQRARLVDSEGGAVDLEQSFAMTEVPLEVDVCLEDVAGQASIQLLAHDMEPATLERIGGYYQRALHAMASDPKMPPQDAQLLSSEERERLDTFGAADEVVTPLDRAPHGWVRHWAERTPDAPAVGDEQGRYTYAQLHARVLQLAGALRESGVHPGDRVGVLHPRTVDLIAALLAVNAVGAAYVPLDPSHPSQRLAFVFEDAGIQVVLTRSEVAEKVPAGLRTIRLDQPLPAGSQAPGLAAEPEQAAYLLYTSGSTGQPKGAVITHGALANLLASMQRTPGVRSTDIGLGIVSVAFDVSAADFYVPLTVGAQVFLASSSTVSDGFSLAQLIDRVRPTVMHATPSACRMLLAAGWAGSPSLRLCCGGEVLAPQLAASLLERVAELWNGYGPTECTVYTTFQRVTDARAEAIPIGRPVCGVQVHVLDAHGRALPIGVPGELCIGGSGLARGYHERAALTEAKFVVLPDGNRVYRSGDRVRFLDDGILDYRERLDHQVKLRGYRIELGEIERALERLPSVRAAVVTFHAAAEGDRLIGYVVAEGSVDALRDGLAQTLPSYMLPAAFVRLAAFPLTPNGKVDRAALPPPELAADPSDPSFAAPRNAAETTLAEIWAEVLGVESVGIDDDFFALGGDSIHSVHIIAKARTRGIVIGAAAMFDTPTIRELAEALTPAGR